MEAVLHHVCVLVLAVNIMVPAWAEKTLSWQGERGQGALIGTSKEASERDSLP